MVQSYDKMLDDKISETCIKELITQVEHKIRHKVFIRVKTNIDYI